MEEYEKIYCFESLYQAHKMARRGKRNTKEVIQYEMRLSENLERLRFYLMHHSYRIRGYYRFSINGSEGERARRCIMVTGSYSTVFVIMYLVLIWKNICSVIIVHAGKGTHFAISRHTCFLRKYYRQYGIQGYILKCDVRKYFNSVDHEVLKRKLQKTSLTEDVKWLLEMMIDSYEYKEGAGLSMGNQTSQWFALYYLDGLDRLNKERLQIRYYTIHG